MMASSSETPYSQLQNVKVVDRCCWRWCGGSWSSGTRSSWCWCWCWSSTRNSRSWSWSGSRNCARHRGLWSWGGSRDCTRHRGLWSWSGSRDGTWHRGLWSWWRRARCLRYWSGFLPGREAVAPCLMGEGLDGGSEASADDEKFADARHDYYCWFFLEEYYTQDNE